MGMMLPSLREEPSAPPDEMRTLMARKEAIEAELDAQLSILQANASTLHSPLLDPDGFPRADIDVWAVRHARVRIIELRNDLNALMDVIMRALQDVYDPAQMLKKEETASVATEAEVEVEAMVEEALVPFAKVNGVAPGSPAAAAGLMREDLLLSFGSLTRSSFASSSLQPLVEFVVAQENQEVSVRVLRAQEQAITLSFTPRSGWGGRGLIGCHIVPYLPS